MYVLFLKKNKSSLLKLGPEGNASLLGILQHPDGTVLKQLQPPPRGPREQEFYNKVRVLHSRGSCLSEGGVTAGVHVTVYHYCHCYKGVRWISEWYITDSLVPVSASFLELSPPWVSVPVPGLLHSQDLGLIIWSRDRRVFMTSKVLLESLVWVKGGMCDTISFLSHVGEHLRIGCL